MACQIGLNAIAQFVGEGDLRDRGIDRDLQLRLIELAERRFDDPVIFLIRIDEHFIVDGIRRDPHALQNRLAAACTSAAAIQGSQAAAVRASLLCRPAARTSARGTGSKATSKAT